MDKTNVVKLAIDTIQNKVEGNFSTSDTSNALRKAFIEANGGSTKIGLKSFRNNPELFQIIEEILPYLAKEGLTGNEFFNTLVEYRNVKLGDMNEFWNKDRSDFIVATLADGTQGVRRQRLNIGEKMSLKTQLKAVKVYEELNRLLAGRVDFNVFVDRVGTSFAKKILEDVYDMFKSVTATTAGLNTNYVIFGAPDEDKVLELVEHVEASTGGTAKIIGTKTALRKVPNAIGATAEVAKADYYNMGYYGKFNGTDMIYVPQQHKTGTDNFIFDNNQIYVIASDDQPIKVVDEGEGLFVTTDATSNGDLTQEYMYAQMYGVGLIFNQKMGFYKFT